MAVSISIPLAEAIERQIGPPQPRAGDRSARLWWSCPFHEDPNPSLCVEPGSQRFRCFGCGVQGDAIDFVRRLDPSLSFFGAVGVLAGEMPRSSARRSRPAKPPRRPEPPPPPAWHALAREIIELSEAVLWSQRGAQTRAYLTGGRGLSDDTIRAARLGFWSRDERRSGVFADRPVWIPHGIVIPWIEGEVIHAINIRRPDVQTPKYAMVRGSRRVLFPGRRAIVSGQPLIVAEGEFDCLLLAQELAGLASVVTLGSASGHPGSRVLSALLSASPWLIAGDRDPAGDSSADGWIGRYGGCRRVAPPVGKDWTEARAQGLDLRAWWSDCLSGSAGNGPKPSAPDPEPDPQRPEPGPPPDQAEPPSSAVVAPLPANGVSSPALPWCTILPTWSEDRRERWGRRANALQAEGLMWHEAEARAFAELADPCEQPPSPADGREKEHRSGDNACV